MPSGERTDLRMKRKGLMAALITALLMVILLPTAASAGRAVRTFEGKEWEARSESATTSILLIGYDHYSRGSIEELHGYSNGGQADFLLLVVLDHRADTIRMLQIDRDAMTSVRTMDEQGVQHGPFKLQICLAHAYGDTREKNNANTVLAVEELLGIAGEDDGAAIDMYIAMDISGISRINDLIGGVTVTLLDDLSSVDPAMKKGATLTLNGKQAEAYVRGRREVGDQTNASRMQRQRQYLEAARKQLIACVKKNPTFAMQLLEEMGLIRDRVGDGTGAFVEKDGGTSTGDSGGKYLMSNKSRNSIISELLKAIDYRIMATETLPGEHSLGSNGYIRYDVEENAGLRWALEVFYSEK